MPPAVPLADGLFWASIAHTSVGYAVCNADGYVTQRMASGLTIGRAVRITGGIAEAVARTERACSESGVRVPIFQRSPTAHSGGRWQRSKYLLPCKR